ncbi:MAG: hypothetical protein LBE01_06825 [Deltaproteobacteria bacterium]|jgi:hypothetical protein|nr:hypothetical protein [Deltaproteobacteria bacterium]
MPDPFKALLAASGLDSELKINGPYPNGLKAAVAASGARLGPLPGSERLYVLAADQFGRLSTVEAIDLAALGLDRGPDEVGGDSPTEGVARFRDGLDELVARLTGVSFVAAAKFAGIVPHRLLAQSSRLLVEADFRLDFLAKAIDEAFAGADEGPAVPPTKPREVSPGRYFLDLKAALAQDPELSSKKILQPFFRETKFEELTIKFDHLPPWLPEAAQKMGYGHRVVQGPEGALVTLAKEPVR